MIATIMLDKKLNSVLTLPNKNHSIKEAVITLFLDKPIRNLDKFDDFYTQTLQNIFTKKETINFEHNEQDAGFKLYRVNQNETDLLMQLSNNQYRQFISLHCLKYIRWQNFRTDFVKILSALDHWLNNKVVAFSLHYIDELNCKDDVIPLESIFRKDSDFLPRRIFDSQNSFLVFNTQRNSDNTKYQHFDRIELKVQNKVVSISHNSIIPIGQHDNFKDFISCNVCSDKLDWAHHQNKELLKDILSQEVQKIIGLI